jgi:hypothetical protein
MGELIGVVLIPFVIFAYVTQPLAQFYRWVGLALLVWSMGLLFSGAYWQALALFCLAAICCARLAWLELMEDHHG